MPLFAASNCFECFIVFTVSSKLFEGPPQIFSYATFFEMFNFSPKAPLLPSFSFMFSVRAIRFKSVSFLSLEINEYNFPFGVLLCANTITVSLGFLNGVPSNKTIRNQQGVTLTPVSLVWDFVNFPFLFRRISALNVNQCNFA